MMKRILLFITLTVILSSCITNAILNTVLVDKKKVTVRPEGERFTINVKSASKVKITTDANWMTLSDKEMKPGLNDGENLYVTTKPATDNYESNATIKFAIDDTTFQEVNVKRPGKDLTKVKDLEGNEYKVRQIGSYYWITENLRSTMYDNLSEPAQQGRSMEKIAFDYPLTALCYMDPTEYDGSFGEMNNYKSKMGLWYNWCGAMGLTVEEAKAIKEGECDDKPRQGICPNGYHIPSLSEWKDLANKAGGLNYGAFKLKSSAGWNEEGAEGTDDYAFSGYPCGYIYQGYKLKKFGQAARFWTSTSFLPGDPEKIGISKYSIRLEGTNDVYSKDYWKVICPDVPTPEQDASSVRCVRNH